VTSYQQHIDAGLDRARSAAAVVPIEVRDLRLAILSDLHRGAGDDADDFRACKHNFAAAVSYYHQKHHVLALLGDAEDLWECWPTEVTREYAASIALEKPFLDAGRYWRFLGNHDEAWQYGILVDLHLRPILGPVEPIESLRLLVTDHGQPLGEIFLVHGHQGSVWEDRLAWFSRRFLRYSWRPIQRLANIKTTTPATDWRLGRKHERAMYHWAVLKEGVIIIAGHTHHPAFPSPARYELLTATYDDLRHQPEAFDAEFIEKIEADLAFARVQEQPCYFNTGCCSFSDGSLTGIEIVRGAIRLIRWSGPQGKARREVLAKADLKNILRDVAPPGVPAPFG
jgi:UDP-2,3-diacylglucosamine pyrophosphatase LpxH